jgi:hypothetical protein
MSYQQTPKLSEPCVRSFDDPASLASTQLASIFVTSLLVVFAVGWLVPQDPTNLLNKSCLADAGFHS